MWLWQWQQLFLLQKSFFFPPRVLLFAEETNVRERKRAKILFAPKVKQREYSEQSYQVSKVTPDVPKLMRVNSTHIWSLDPGLVIGEVLNTFKTFRSFSNVKFFPIFFKSSNLCFQKHFAGMAYKYFFLFFKQKMGGKFAR